MLTARLSICVLWIALLGFGRPAFAGPSADALASCMLEHMTPEEGSVYIRWIFGALGAHPDVASMGPVTDSQYEPIARAFAQTTQRLLTTQCRVEAIEALRKEGQSSILVAFQKVGQISARRLMSHPKVEQRIGSYGKYLDKDKLDALGAEASR